MSCASLSHSPASAPPAASSSARPGSPPEDLPVVAARVYRGSNAGDAPGAGLGPFIVRYLVEQMGGGLSLENAEPGLAAILEFPLAS